MKAKTQDKIFHSIMLFCSLLVIGLLLLILGYVGYKGIGLIDWQFISGEFDAKTVYVDIEDAESLGLEVEVVTYDTKRISCD